MKKICLLIAITVLTSGSVLAQFSDQAEIKEIKSNVTGLQPVSKPFSLIDLSRVKWSHAYSVSYFSGGSYSGSVGMYTGSIFYEFSKSLSLDVKLGLAHNPGALFDSRTDNEAAFFPAFNLDYHPSDKFRLSIGYAKYPGFNPYGYRYRSDYFGRSFKR